MNHCHFSLYVFQDFYEDIFEELSKYGEIENLNVCDNLADHMVTNLQKHLNSSKTWPFFFSYYFPFESLFYKQRFFEVMTSKSVLMLHCVDLMWFRLGMSL
jgi:hypothetical protein